MACLKLLSANMGAAVLPGQPAKAIATKAGKPVFKVDASNNRCSLEANSSDSSSYGSMANEKENMGKKCHK
jgi:hypothetical protein